VSFGLGFVTPPLAEIYPTDSAADGTTQSTYTFTSRSLGAAAQSRFIIVGVGTRSNAQSVTSLTIGGVSASILKRQASAFNTAELWGALVPTGTTGNIVVAWSSAPTKCVITVHRTLYLQQYTPINTYGSTTNPLSVLANAPNGSVAVAFGFPSNNGSNTWTGLTEDVDAIITVAGSPQSYTAASARFITDQSSLSITCSAASGTYVDPTMAVVIMR
jgi:hypothetical protein